MYQPEPDLAFRAVAKSKNLFQSFRSRKIATMPKANMLVDDIVYIKSNAPAIKVEEKHKFAAGTEGIVIASASLSAVALACELASNSKIVPRLIIVDNSVKAEKFWRLVTKLFADYPSTEGADHAFAKLLEENPDFFQRTTFKHDLENYISERVDWLGETIYKSGGYEFFRKVLLRSTYVLQDWQDKTTFAKLKATIDSRDYKNVVVYAANIPTYTTVNASQQILANIYQLRPSLVIHSNINVITNFADALLYLEGEENRPELVLPKLAAAISFKTPADYRSYPLSSQLSAVTRDMEAALIYMLRSKEYTFDNANIYLADIIFRMAGVELNCAVDFKVSRLRPSLIFYLDLSIDEAGKIISLLNLKLKGINAGFALVGEAESLAQYPSMIALSMHYIKDYLVRQMPKFLLDNPQRVKAYNFSHNVVPVINSVLAPFHVSAYKTDAFEESLCYMAAADANARSIVPIKSITTTNSYFVNDNVSMDKTAIYISTSLSAAQYIIDYLNSIEENSATLAPEQHYCLHKKEFLTKISVKNTVLVSEKFKYDLYYAMQHCPEDKLRQYQQQSGYEAKSVTMSM